MKSRKRSGQGVAFKFNPPRAILLGAVSTPEQARDDKASLDDQFQVLRQAAARQPIPWRISDEIVIPGVSRDYRTWREFCEAAEAEGVHDPWRMFEHWKTADFDILAVINASRFARTSSILQEVVGRTYEDARAYIFTLENQVISFENRGLFGMMEGHRVSNEINEMVRRHDMGMRYRASLGFHSSPKQNTFHEYHYDGQGQPVKEQGRDGNPYYLTVKRHYQRLYDDLFDELVNRHTPYDTLEIEMAKRGHLNEKGHKYYFRFFASHLWQPPFHGATGYSIYSRRQRWMIDPAYADAVPEGTSMFYGVCEAVYPGEQGQWVRAELYRRQDFQGGKARPQRLHRFTGLLVCGACGYGLNYNGGHGVGYYICRARYNLSYHQDGVTCSQNRVVRERDLIAFVGDYLRELTAAPDFRAALSAYYPQTPAAPNLDAEIAAAEARLQTLTERLADPRVQGAALEKIYSALDQLTRQVEALRQRRKSVQAQTGQLAARAANLTAVLAQHPLATLWEQDETTINHLLHHILGDLRVVCLDGLPRTIRRAG